MTDDGYETIDIRKKGDVEEEDIEFEVQDDEEFENEDDSLEQDQVEESEEDTDEEDEDNPSPTNDEEDDDEEQQEDPKKSRAQKRINQLYRQSKEWEEKYQRDITEAQKIINELKEQRDTETESFLEEQKASLDKNIAALEDQIKRSLEEGDHEGFVKAQKELSESTFKRQVLNARKPKTYSKKVESSTPSQQEQPRTQQQQQNTVPEEGMKWIERNPDFKKNRAFQSLAVGINSELIEEGYDPEDPDFYQELDSRINEFRGVNKQKKGVPPVASGQRTDSPKKKKSGNKVILTKEELRLAKKFGMSPERYARQKKNLEKSSSGYINIG